MSYACLACWTCFLEHYSQIFSSVLPKSKIFASSTSQPSLSQFSICERGTAIGSSLVFRDEPGASDQIRECDLIIHVISTTVGSEGLAWLGRRTKAALIERMSLEFSPHNPPASDSSKRHQRQPVCAALLSCPFAYSFTCIL